MKCMFLTFLTFLMLCQRVAADEALEDCNRKLTAARQETEDQSGSLAQDILKLNEQVRQLEQGASERRSKSKKRMGELRTALEKHKNDTLRCGAELAGCSKTRQNFKMIKYFLTKRLQGAIALSESLKKQLEKQKLESKKSSCPKAAPEDEKSPEENVEEGNDEEKNGEEGNGEERNAKPKAEQDEQCRTALAELRTEKSTLLQYHDAMKMIIEQQDTDKRKQDEEISNLRRGGSGGSSALASLLGRLLVLVLLVSNVTVYVFFKLRLADLEKQKNKKKKK